MESFPAFFPMTGRRVVVLGGGEAARRKARLVKKTPATLRVYAPRFAESWAPEFDINSELIARQPQGNDLEGAALVIVASEDPVQDAAWACLARRAGVPVNVVDRPEMCDFTVPALVDRGAVVAAVTTGGAAPVLARDVRARLEAALPKGVGVLAGLARSLRRRVADALPHERDRKAFWQRALRGPARDRALAGDAEGAKAALEDALANAAAPQGVVHIVGAGPGDAELLTLKALRLLQDADVIFHDSLIGPDILDLARRDADRIFVGKRAAKHAVPQEDIHALMVERARAGERVGRLKGGDPFVCGRGGEELEAVRAVGVEAHVVPGVSSALGCAASIGAPLTHRDHAQSVTFVTAHAKRGEPDLDWPALARPNQTVVVFMGRAQASGVALRLMAAGRSGETPVAVVENGTRPDEQVFTGTLDALARLAAQTGNGPVLMIIGEAAGQARARANLNTRALERAA